MTTAEQLNQQLSQLAALLKKLTAEAYSRKCRFLSNAAIGSHTRHIIELLQCAAAGYSSGVTDYINRERNLHLENDIELALEQIETLKNCALLPDKMMHIVCEDGSLVHTSYQRELVYNVEHIIHHLALIRVSLLEFNLDIVDENFGMAYSTIRYRQTQQKV